MTDVKAMVDGVPEAAIRLLESEDETAVGKVSGVQNAVMGLPCSVQDVIIVYAKEKQQLGQVAPSDETLEELETLKNESETADIDLDEIISSITIQDVEDIVSECYEITHSDELSSEEKAERVKYLLKQAEARGIDFSSGAISDAIEIWSRDNDAGVEDVLQELDFDLQQRTETSQERGGNGGKDPVDKTQDSAERERGQRNEPEGDAVSTDGTDSEKGGDSDSVSSAETGANGEKDDLGGRAQEDNKQQPPSETIDSAVQTSVDEIGEEDGAEVEDGDGMDIIDEQMLDDGDISENEAEKSGDSEVDLTSFVGGAEEVDSGQNDEEPKGQESQEGSGEGGQEVEEDGALSGAEGVTSGGAEHEPSEKKGEGDGTENTSGQEQESEPQSPGHSSTEDGEDKATGEGESGIFDELESLSIDAESAGEQQQDNSGGDIERELEDFSIDATANPQEETSSKNEGTDEQEAGETTGESHTAQDQNSNGSGEVDGISEEKMDTAKQADSEVENGQRSDLGQEYQDSQFTAGGVGDGREVRKEGQEKEDGGNSKVKRGGQRKGAERQDEIQNVGTAPGPAHTRGVEGEGEGVSPFSDLGRAQDTVDVEYVYAEDDPLVPEESDIDAAGVVKGPLGMYWQFIKTEPVEWSVKTPEEKAQISSRFQRQVLAPLEYDAKIVYLPTELEVGGHIEHLKEVSSRSEHEDGGENNNSEPAIVNISRNYYTEWFSDFVNVNDMTSREFFVCVPVSPSRVQSLEKQQSFLFQLQDYPIVGRFASKFVDEDDITGIELMRELETRVDRIKGACQSNGMEPNVIRSREESLKIAHAFLHGGEAVPGEIGGGGGFVSRESIEDGDFESITAGPKPEPRGGNKD
jgi:hypothetical protein